MRLRERPEEQRIPHVILSGGTRGLPGNPKCALQPEERTRWVCQGKLGVGVGG